MTTPAPLIRIIAYARSGALDHAWRMFREAGLEGSQDAAVCTLRGRLLKDSARAAAPGERRRRLYTEAAQAYAQAGALGGGSYPLINAATLMRLAGARDESARLAAQVLSHLAEAPDEPETPYWKAATEAEALLLLGRTAEARAALTAAVGLAPHAWEDQAATLRQFDLLLGETGEDAAWLDALRPPRTLHFAGHLQTGLQSADLKARVAQVLAAERVGFGYGALAAGADIVVAEALVEAGGQLHVVLPGSLDDFRATSVAAVDPLWAARFERLLEQAESVRSIASDSAGADPSAIHVAAEAAMGAAAMQAEILATEAVQLLVLEDGEESASAWMGQVWRGAGRRQVALQQPRVGPPAAGSPPGPGSAGARVALLLVRAAADLPELGALPDRLAGLAEPSFAPRWQGADLLLAFARVSEAAAAAQGLIAQFPVGGSQAIAGHYGVVNLRPDPFGGPALPAGKAAALPTRMLPSVPSGAIHLSEDFATALHAAPSDEVCRTEFIGELPGADLGEEIRLYSLKRKPAEAGPSDHQLLQPPR